MHYCAGPCTRSLPVRSAGTGAPFGLGSPTWPLRVVIWARRRLFAAGVAAGTMVSGGGRSGGRALMTVEDFAVVDDRDLRPLIDKLTQHGAGAVFSRVQDRTVAHVRLPLDEQEADICRGIIEDWNRGILRGS